MNISGVTRTNWLIVEMEKSVNLLNFTFRPSIFKNLTDVRVLSSKFDTLIAVDSSKDKFKQINHYKWMAV